MIKEIIYGLREDTTRGSLLIGKALVKVGAAYEPSYRDWFARKTWTILEASCLFNGIEWD
jgi:hypothetical protein